MAKFRRERMTLDEAMECIGAKWTGEPHIVFDKNVQPQYWIIRQQSHDGTQIFTNHFIQDALMPLFCRDSFHKPMGEPPSDYVPFYTIGEIKLATVYGTVDLPAGRYPGQRERIVIPVHCEYRPVNNSNEKEKAK